jgi:hypothetical protein
MHVHAHRVLFINERMCDRKNCFFSIFYKQSRYFAFLKLCLNKYFTYLTTSFISKYSFSYRFLETILKNYAFPIKLGMGSNQKVENICSKEFYVHR